MLTSLGILVLGLIVGWTLGYSVGCTEEREYWARLGRAPLPRKKTRQ